MTGPPVNAAQDVLAKRRQGGVTQYLIRWAGYYAEDDTWEPAAHMSAKLLSDFNESRMGLQEETDNDDSGSENGDGEDSGADDDAA